MNDAIENKFYVYAYLDPRKLGVYKYGKYKFNYEPFYIGKGKNNRLYDHLKINKKINKRNSFKNNKIRKIIKLGLSPIVIKIEENLSQKESFGIEKKIISLIGHYHGKNRGVLTNLCDGGWGAAGHTVPKKSRINISIHNSRYWLNKHFPRDAVERSRIKNKNQDRSHEYRKYLLISPEKEEYIVDDGLQKFADKYGLQRAKLVSVATGNRNHHQGWKCSIIDCKIRPRDRKYKLLNLLTKEELITDDIKKISKEKNLDSRRLYEVARGKRYLHRGWTCKVI